MSKIAGILKELEAESIEIFRETAAFAYRHNMEV